MRLAELYERAVNWPKPSAIFIAIVIALLIGLIGFIIFYTQRVRFGRILGIVGVLTIMGGLFVLTEQTFTERQSNDITIKRYRFRDQTRQVMFAVMTIVPCAAVGLGWLGMTSTRHRARGQYPKHLKEGRRLLARKELDGALRQFTLAIHAAPELAEGYFRRGSVYLEMGDTDHGMTDLERAISCDPRHAGAHMERAKLRSEKGDLDGALDDFARVMSVRANDPQIYLHRGACLVKKGLLGEAASDFNRVLKLTNHSDYAEPAKLYLAQLEQQRIDQSPVFGVNGSPAQPTSVPTGPQDPMI